MLEGNEFQCVVLNSGRICLQIFTSPLSQGGYWPAGTPNGYVYGSGIQVAGLVGADGGPWAGDTTAAFFFDARGSLLSGTPLTDVYDSTEPEDLTAWPAEARIPDDGLFQPTDVGRAAISRQDTWTRYWDGDPNRNSGRPHPLGISVTQRSMQWSYPSGAESVIYFVFDLENVTADDEFQALNEAQFFGGDDALPSEGYTLRELNGRHGRRFGRPAEAGRRGTCVTAADSSWQAAYISGTSSHRAARSRSASSRSSTRTATDGPSDELRTDGRLS